MSAPFQVAIRDINGAMQPGKVEVIFLDDKNQIVATQTLDVGGNIDVPVPPELSKVHGPVRVKFVASAGTKTVGIVEEPIVSAKPALAAHVALNKLIFKPGDKLQVRALVLDRFTLQPAAAASKFSIALANESGQAVAPAIDMTTFAGIGAGEIALSPKLAEGNYTLQASGDGLTPVLRRIEVLPATAPPVEFVSPNNRFRAGEPITQQMQFNYKNGAPGRQHGGCRQRHHRGAKRQSARQRTQTHKTTRSIPRIIANPQANRAVNNIDFNGKTDATGRLELKLPGIANVQTGSQQLQADVEYGDDTKNRATVSRGIVVEPNRVVVEFFPEGGRLIAGTENRVFYRVRTPEGSSAASARIAIEASKAPVFECTTESQCRLIPLHARP